MLSSARSLQCSQPSACPGSCFGLAWRGFVFDQAIPLVPLPLLMAGTCPSWPCGISRSTCGQFSMHPGRVPLGACANLSQRVAKQDLKSGVLIYFTFMEQRSVQRPGNSWSSRKTTKSSPLASSTTNPLSTGKTTTDMLKPFTPAWCHVLEVRRNKEPRHGCCWLSGEVHERQLAPLCVPLTG